jgi:osmotically inducible lipoprotein OsmB
MKSKLAIGAMTLALAAASFSVHAIGKNEKGCLAGGAIGGVAGHLLGGGSSTVVGAVGGCAVGAVVADKRKQKDSRYQVNARDRERARVAAHDSRRDDRPVTERRYPQS